MSTNGKTMAILRALVWLQVMCFMFSPPFAVAALFGDVRGLVAAIPWILFCAFLSGWVQAKGLATYEESKYLPVAWIGGTDTFHLGLLKFNVAVAVVLGATLITRSLV
jgi:hypothetical protein